MRHRSRLGRHHESMPNDLNGRCSRLVQGLGEWCAELGNHRPELFVFATGHQKISLEFVAHDKIIGGVVAA